MVTKEPPFTGITFEGQDPGETFQFYFRQHWIRMIPAFLGITGITLLFAAIGTVIFWTNGISHSGSEHIALLFLLAFFLLAHMEFLLRFYRYFLRVIVVTDKRVHRLKKTVFLTNEHQSIDLWSLQDIRKSQQGLIQNLFGFGSITLDAYDTQLRIHFVSDVTEKCTVLVRLMEQARATRETPKRGISD